VALASHVGTVKAGASAIDDKAAPLAALYKSSATQVSYHSLDSAQSDAPEKSTAPQADKLPHSADPTLSLVGRGGIAVVAGQSLQFANAETSNFMSGQDTQMVTGGQLRMHAGQAIGILGGAISPGTAPGEGNKGLTLIAAQNPVRYEAQSSTIAIQAKDLVNIQSANAHIDWAAAKSISLSTADGANITLSGGNITVQCPGKLTAHSSLRRFEDAGRMSYPLPALPRIHASLAC
jgi:type VI secretion system secreted protein VgrG